MASRIDRFRRWWQPSLTGRVVGMLLVGILLVLVVLVGWDFVTYRRSLDQMEPLQDAVQALATALPADEAGAVQVVRASEHQYNELRRKQLREFALKDAGLLFELQRMQDGRVVYASPGLGARVLPAQDTPVLTLDVAGQRHSAVQAQVPAWRVRLLQPVVDDVQAVQVLVREIIGSILIAIPCVLIPVWLAVRRGLAPLRQLVAEVTGRKPGDFSPLKQQLRLAELKPLVDTFNQLFSRSSDALERERGLVQDAAHELRTPLAVIATQSHALVNAPDRPAQAQALERLELAIARASHQVHQVLTLARMEGRGARRPETVECVETVRQALIDAEPRARERGIDLSLDAPERLDAVLDRVAFHSILDNLLVNALLHAGGATRVQVELQAQHERLRLRVADDGAGIAEEDRPRLFERFHRGRQASAPGTGLGLAIVREAARLMGGDVRLGAGLGGRGAGFDVDLPVRPAAA